jgi:hypothetical protein
MDVGGSLSFYGFTSTPHTLKTLRATESFAEWVNEAGAITNWKCKLTCKSVKMVLDAVVRSRRESWMWVNATQSEIRMGNLKSKGILTWQSVLKESKSYSLIENGVPLTLSKGHSHGREEGPSYSKYVVYFTHSPRSK